MGGKKNSVQGVGGAVVGGGVYGGAPIKKMGVKKKKKKRVKNFFWTYFLPKEGLIG